MNIIVHNSKSEDGMIALKKRVASVHTGVAVNYIKKLNCPKEQKIELIEQIKCELLNRDG